MQLGRFFGIFCIIIGGIFSYLGFSMLDEAGMTLKVFTAGPGLIGLGVAMLFFPGGDITAAESRNKVKDPKTFISGAPVLHLVIWAVAFLGGMLISAWLRK